MSGIECAFFGALSRDGELKTSKAGRRYLRLNVRIGDADGSQWVNLMAFDEKAIEQADKFIKGAKVYIEGGGLKIDEWTGADGAKRHGLSCMSWHTRLTAIGRNKPAKSKPKITSIDVATPSRAALPNDLNDDLPF
jgi:single-stranded DNA-binding protein